MNSVNRFFTDNFNAPIGSLAKSAAIEAVVRQIQEGFTLVQAELDRIQGAGGITSLSGFPASFSGAAGKTLVVNTAESALEFASAGRLVIEVLTGTSYTLKATDAGKLLLFTNTEPITVTVDAGVLSRGDVVCIRQNNSGQVTVVASGGVTVSSTDNLMSTRKQSAQIALICDNEAGDQFCLIGERNAPTLNFASLLSPNIYTGLQSSAFVTLTDGANIAVNAALGNNFRLVIGGNRTLSNPTGLADGAVLNIRIKQDGTGGRTLAYGSKYKWPSGSAPALSTASGAVDLLVAQYSSTDDTLTCVLQKGFA